MKTRRLVIYDTTLRDGEQCPGASLGALEKERIARQLERLGVDVVEAGFPASSPGDFDAVRRVARAMKRCRVAALARCVESDIRAAAAALKGAGGRGRIHVFLGTSELHRKYKLKKSKDEILRLAEESVRLARSLCADVQFSAEDASRTEEDFLAEVVRRVLAAGAGTVNVPDTVGYAVPGEFAARIRRLREAVPELKGAALHVHCHNDLGLALANTLAAVEAGATGAECTVNGLGERAGNCALEELVMALKVRGDAYGVRTGVEPRLLVPTSRLVERLAGMPVPRNKAVVGANAFSHESGIHQDGVLKNPATYEIMRPADVGMAASDELALGKHSGRAGLKAHLERMGVKASPRELGRLYRDFVALADKKKAVYDDDLMGLLREHQLGVPQVYRIQCLQVSAGNRSIPTATLRLEKGGETMEDSATGAGPVEAALKAIDRVTGVEGRLKAFSMQAVTHGEDALGEAAVQVRFGDDLVSARGLDIDIVMASAKAYVNALNRHLMRTEGGGRG